MKADLLSRLACPRCRGPVNVVDPTAEGSAMTHGMIRCTVCGHTYPVVNGVPRMVLDVPSVRETQVSFGAQWRRRRLGQFESETLFGRTAEEELEAFFHALDVRPEALRDRWTLDAGCGAGRLTVNLAAFGGHVVGLDVAPTVEWVADRGVHLRNLHVLQGSLLDIPLVDDSFDIVWSMGVIHHTGDTPRAFANLARVVRPGGRLYVWVYSSRELSLYKMIRDTMRVAHKLPKDVLFYLCYVMAPPLKLYHLGKFGLRRLRRRPTTPRERREAQIRTIAFELHDDLAPPHQTRHTPEEVSEWFRGAGFTNLVVVDEVGVRGERRGPAT